MPGVQISSDQVREWLRSVDLEEYYPGFEAAKITPYGFISLTVQDYQSLGITKLVDKQKLFRLIMTLKKQEDLVKELGEHERQLQAGASVSGMGGNSSVNNGIVEEPERLDRPVQNSNIPRQTKIGQSPKPSSRHEIPDQGVPNIYDYMPSNSSQKPPTYNSEQNKRPGHRRGPSSELPSASSMQQQQQQSYQQPQRRQVIRDEPSGSGQPILSRGENDIYQILNVHPNFNPEINTQYRIRGIPTSIGTVLPTPDEFERQVRQRIRVVVRKRPLLPHEISRGEHNIVTCDAWNQCSVHEPKIKVDLTKYTDIHAFTFDQVFNENSNNEEIYRYTAKPLISVLFTGGKATCFAYGQTGSGKTYTMMEKKTGIYVLAAKDIFQNIEYMTKYGPQNLIDKLQGCRENVNAKMRLPPIGIEAYTAFFEIYGGNLYDLLNDRNKLFAREDTKGKVNVAGLKELRIQGVEELFRYIDAGLTSRATGTTSANADSSRSHAILQIILRYPPKEDDLRLYNYKLQQVREGTLPPEELMERPKGREFGKISFIDLAGSERAADTMNSDRQTRMEGAEINKSLLSLKECIRALDMQSGHKPFRGSKLTMVLKDSFVGEARTVMIANISPTNKSSENTLNTLHYSDRVKELSTRGGKSKMAPTLRLMENAAEVVLQSGNSGYGQAVFDVPPGRGGSSDRPDSNGRSSSVGYEREASSTPPASDSAPDELARSHQDLVSQIYILEDEIIQEHRKEVNQMMALMKQEVTLLNKIEQDNISMDEWIHELHEILAQKAKSIENLQDKVRQFQNDLKKEEDLSRTRSFHSP